jgi:hypothetical protein
MGKNYILRLEKLRLKEPYKGSGISRPAISIPEVSLWHKEGSWEDDPLYQSLLVRILPLVRDSRHYGRALDNEKYVIFDDPLRLILLVPLLLPIPVRKLIPWRRVPTGKIDVFGLIRLWSSFNWMYKVLEQHFTVQRYGTNWFGDWQPFWSKYREILDYQIYLWKQFDRDDIDDVASRNLFERYKAVSTGLRCQEFLQSLHAKIVHLKLHMLRQHGIYKKYDSASEASYTYENISLYAHLTNFFYAISDLASYILLILFHLSRYFEHKIFDQIESAFPVFPCRSPPPRIPLVTRAP